jgi:hypothetical protein
MIRNCFKTPDGLKVPSFLAYCVYFSAQNPGYALKNKPYLREKLGTFISARGFKTVS